MKQKLSNGTLLGPYKIVRLLSKGGMGEVYEAYEELLNRKVALKIIAAEETEGLDVVNLFISEGQALAKINHPNVVTIYRLGLDNGHYYIAMEFVEGYSLNEFVKKNNPTLDEKLRVFINILNGTQVLHAKNIIHRDLKPKNIIIEPDNNAKIVDFGISEIVKENNVLTKKYGNKILGSVFYMSPEAARGEPISFQSDIWSLGVILYELVTGEKPFFDTTAAGVLKKVRTEKISFSLVDRIKLHDNLKKIINKMCDPALHNRYKNVNEVKNDLSIFIQENFMENTGPTQNSSTFGEFTKSGITKSPRNLDLTEVIHYNKAPAHTPNPYQSSDLHKSFNDRNYNAKKIVLGFLLLIIFAIPISYKYKDKILNKSVFKNASQLPKSEKRSIAAEHTNANNELSEVPFDQKQNAIKAESNLSDNSFEEIPPAATLEPTPMVETTPAIEAAPLAESTAQPKPTPSVKANVEPKLKKVISLSQVRIQSSKTKLTLVWNKNYQSRGLASDHSHIRNLPSMKWNSLPDAFEYELQIASDKNFRSLVINERLRETTYKWQKPYPGKHYWRVRALRDQIKGNYSQTGFMNILLPAPSFKQNSYVVSGAGATTPINLGWQTVPLASSYKLLVSNHKNMSQPIIDTIVTNNELSINLNNNNSRYYATLMALNKDRSPASVSTVPIQIDIIKRINLSIPQLLIPENGTTVPTEGTIITPIIFNWSNANEAKTYNLQISSDSKFTDIIFSTSSHEVKYLFTQPLPRKRIYWRVQSVNGRDKSKWSDARYLDIE